jgi:hypothetical protein
MEIKGGYGVTQLEFGHEVNWRPPRTSKDPAIDGWEQRHCFPPTVEFFLLVFIESLSQQRLLFIKFFSLNIALKLVNSQL